jgi:hypothetical protein
LFDAGSTSSRFAGARFKGIGAAFLCNILLSLKLTGGILTKESLYMMGVLVGLGT